MTAMPEMSPYREMWCSPYSRAAGSSSSKEMNTMTPATAAKSAPMRVGPIRGWSTSQASSAPSGSARPEKKE